MLLCRLLSKVFLKLDRFSRGAGAWTSSICWHACPRWIRVAKKGWKHFSKLKYGAKLQFDKNAPTGQCEEGGKLLIWKHLPIFHHICAFASQLMTFRRAIKTTSRWECFKLAKLLTRKSFHKFFPTPHFRVGVSGVSFCKWRVYRVTKQPNLTFLNSYLLYLKFH